MLSHYKRTITVVDFDGGDFGRPRKRRRVEWNEDDEDVPDVKPENDLKEFHNFEKLPNDVRKEIFSYFSEVELMGMVRTSQQFYELQKSLIQPLLSCVRLNRLKATRPDPDSLSLQQIADRVQYVKTQLIAHEKEYEAMKQELQRLHKLKLERSDLTVLQKFDLWRHADVPKKIHKYAIDDIKPEGAQDLWRFLQDKHPYGFADRREFLSLEKITGSLEYALGLNYDSKAEEWTGDAASMELFTKYVTKLMEVDFGGCYWDW
jgi:hypothetical protein